MTQLRQLCCFILLLLGAVASGLRADSDGGRVDPSRVRVISQTLGSDELLLAIADPSQIAALSHLSRDPHYSSVVKEAAAYPQLTANADAESALALRPTLVLCADYSRAELVSQVRKAGIRIIIFSKYSTLEDAYENMRLLARELGPEAERRAEAVIASCQARVKALAERLAGAPKVRVLAPSVYGLIPGSETNFQDLCDHAGADNLAATLGGIKGHKPPPSERLLTWPIDRVIVSGTDLERALEPFRRTAPYSLLPAVRAGRGVVLPQPMMSCISHHRVAGYEALARALHPERFSDEVATGTTP